MFSFVFTRSRGEPSMVICRSQVHRRTAAFDAFADHLPNDSARMYALAALSGISVHEHMAAVYAVGPGRQVC